MQSSASIAGFVWPGLRYIWRLIERGVSILVNYIKVPLAFVYALLLHAYAVKILMQQNMPQGEVGTVVTLFAIAGTLAWLLTWPFRDTGA